MNYKVTIPRSRGFKVKPEIVDSYAHAGYPHRVNQKTIRDMFLYAMFARITANDDTNWEFETYYNEDTETIELSIPEDFIQIIENTKKGANFKRYIKWLIEDSGFWEYDEDDDIITSKSKVCFNNYAGFSEVIDNNVSLSSTPIINWCLGNKQIITLDENVSFEFEDPCCGTTSLQLIIKQDDVGGHTLSWPSSVKFVNGSMPSYTTTANSVDIWSFFWDGAQYYATLAPNFS